MSWGRSYDKIWADFIQHSLNYKRGDKQMDFLEYLKLNYHNPAERIRTIQKKK